MNVGPPQASLLRRLTRENKAIGPRLAQLEFQNLSNELLQEDLFELNLDMPSAETAPPPQIPVISSLPDAHRLATLNVTLGRTAWIEDPASLPVVGILVRGTEMAPLQAALLALLRKHYIDPFARYVFLCDTMRMIPFLGRYEFTYEHIGAADPVEIAQRMHLRYGMLQLRDLLTGRPVWKHISKPSP